MKDFLLGINFQAKGRNRRPALFERQPGQAIVLIALLMIVLLGFTGLAVDGGEMYFLQRDAQNAVDAAVLAAMWQWCGANNPQVVPEGFRHDLAKAAALAAAKANGFEDGVDGTTVTFTRPATPPGSGTPDNNLITVTIVANKEGRLIQVVYQGPLQVTAKATGRCTPAAKFTQGAAMMGIGNCTGSTPGIDLSGSDINVVGDPGALRSNGSVDHDGSNYGGSGTIQAVGSVDSGVNGGGTVTSPAPAVTVPPFYSINDFDARYNGRIAAFAAAQGSGQYYAVTSGGLVTSWDDFPGTGHPKPGVYFAYEGISLNSSDFNGLTDDRLAGVVLASPGVIDLGMGNAGGDPTFVHIPYVVDAQDAEDYGIPPVLPLIFSTAGDGSCANSNDAITINGKYLWEGMLYAPNGQIAISTSASGSASGALIGITVSFSGSSITIYYEPDVIPPTPPQVGVIQ